MHDNGASDKSGFSPELRLYADGKITAVEYLRRVRERIGQEVRRERER